MPNLQLVARRPVNFLRLGRDGEFKRDQKVEISATGIIRRAQDGSDWTFVTPDGTRPPHASHFPHPDAGIGSLILRVGRAIYAAG